MAGFLSAAAVFLLDAGAVLGAVAGFSAAAVFSAGAGFVVETGFSSAACLLAEVAACAAFSRAAAAWRARRSRASRCATSRAFSKLPLFKICSAVGCTSSAATSVFLFLFTPSPSCAAGLGLFCTVSVRGFTGGTGLAMLSEAACTVNVSVLTVSLCPAEGAWRSAGCFSSETAGSMVGAGPDDAPAWGDSTSGAAGLLCSASCGCLKSRALFLSKVNRTAAIAPKATMDPAMKLNNPLPCCFFKYISMPVRN